MRNTSVSATNTWNGNSTSRFIGVHRLRVWFRFCRRFVDRADHVERALRVILEFIPQDALTAVQRVFETDEFPFEAAELFRL